MSNVIGIVLVCVPFTLAVALRYCPNAETALAAAIALLVLGALPLVLGIGLLVGWI